MPRQRRSDHHARTDDRARRRRARRSGETDDGSVMFSIPTVDVEIWRRTEPGTAPPQQRLRALTKLVEPASRSASAWRRSCPGSPTSPSCSPTSCALRATRARPASGRTPASPARDERALPRCARAGLAGAAAGVRAALRATRVPSAAHANPVREQVRELARTLGIRDRRRIKLEPPPDPEQLQLAI